MAVATLLLLLPSATPNHEKHRRSEISTTVTIQTLAKRQDWQFMPASRNYQRPLIKPVKLKHHRLAVKKSIPTHPSLSYNWHAVAQCESGGNWRINTGNGFYGGLQFTLTTWRSFGGVGMPNEASRAQQIAIADKVLASQGRGAWPICGKYL